MNRYMIVPSSRTKRRLFAHLTNTDLRGPEQRHGRTHASAQERVPADASTSLKLIVVGLTQGSFRQPRAITWLKCAPMEAPTIADHIDNLNATIRRRSVYNIRLASRSISIRIIAACVARHKHTYDLGIVIHRRRDLLILSPRMRCVAPISTAPPLVSPVLSATTPRAHPRSQVAALPAQALTC